MPKPHKRPLPPGPHSDLTSRQQAALMAAARKASRGGVAPFSGFKVGAAILAGNGAIVTGANVESASYGLTCCAERVALFKALTSGLRKFRAVAVVAPVLQGPMPCGACRQLLAEYALEAILLTADSRAQRRPRQFTVSGLLPEPFLRVPGK